MIYLQVHLT